MGGPELEAWVILFDVEDERGGVPEVGGRYCGCDEFGLAFGILEDSERLMRGPPQADGAEVDAEGGSDGTVVRVLVVTGKSIFWPLSLFFCLHHSMHMWQM